MPPGDPPPPQNGVVLDAEAARVLFPLHIVTDEDGRILQTGPTIDRIFQTSLTGHHLLSVFDVQRPRFATSWDKLHGRTGSKLILTARPDTGDKVEFRALSAPFGLTGVARLFDLSFGPGVSDAITRFDLTRHDFRPDDYSFDIVYSFETQRSLLEDSKRLTNALKQARDEAERRANLDPVTGIANRRALHTHLNECLADKQDQTMHALLHLDLDKFKPINDTFGHATGDEVLIRISGILADTVDAGATAARVGGDEFVILLPGMSSQGDLDRLINDLMARICAPLKIGSHRFRVGVSVGAVRFRAADYSSADRLLQHSDIALYDAKRKGNSFSHLDASMLQRREDTASLVQAIEGGLEAGEFVPHFQLQVDAVSGRVHGVEVLARWHRNDGAVCAPAAFLTAASYAGLMGQIDDAVRSTAISTFAAWRRRGLPIGGISINLSPGNLRSADFCEAFQDEVFRAGLSPQSVRLELLESILFGDSDQFLTQQAIALHTAGFPLMLDDFGTGHASIATLVDLPIAMIKIDRSFVQGIDFTPKKRRIVKSILAMAESLGLRVMAEGVETRAELNVIKNAGCRYFQGYYFARPLPAAATTRLLEDWGQGAERPASAVNHPMN